MSESHTLTRIAVEERQIVLEPDGEGGLRQNHNMDSSLMGYEEKQTVECTCGERFRKEETALDHLQSETDD